MDITRLKEVLERFRCGEAEMDEVTALLSQAPFEVLPEAVVDTHRSLRKGFPEVVFGLSKSTGQIVSIAKALMKDGSNVLITKADGENAAALAGHFGPENVLLEESSGSVLVKHHEVEMVGAGLIVVVAAGTSDLPVSREAAFCARAFGNEVEELYDVGVAGVHRLLHHRDLLQRARVLIVVAGMEGALPSVVGGLVAAPIIAVPTSVGYGASFGGIAALLGMLNSCSPGVTVVNIDNGFGAAYAAALMNRRS